MRTETDYFAITAGNEELTCDELFDKLPEATKATLDAYGVICMYKTMRNGKLYLAVETYPSCD